MSDRPMLTGPLVIVYHGTDEASARRIQQQGFAAHTYFARHLEDAVGYGGEHVFEVAFPEASAAELARARRSAWQFVTPWGVPPSWIVAHTAYRQEPIARNDRLRKLVSESRPRR